MASSTSSAAFPSPSKGPIQRVNLISQINSGGIGSSQQSTTLVRGSGEYDRQYFPGQRTSLSGIATRAFVLGNVLSASMIIMAYLLLFASSPLWRIPFFLASLAVFHFLEYWTTARYNTPEARVSSYLLSSNGNAYNLAHTAAIAECFVTNAVLPKRHWLPTYLSGTLILVGLMMTAIGQAVRSGAMVQAGTNFNHVVQHRKANKHQLVTTGLYSYFRHPSYFGFFYWGLGTQVVLGNTICFITYTIVLWKFFSRRISGEEELLVAFFGDDYIKYRQSTKVWIPFIR